MTSSASFRHAMLPEDQEGGPDEIWQDEQPRRWGTHYDTIPHGNCYDPKHCDCECPGCAPVKER